MTTPLPDAIDEWTRWTFVKQFTRFNQIQQVETGMECL